MGHFVCQVTVSSPGGEGTQFLQDRGGPAEKLKSLRSRPLSRVGRFLDLGSQPSEMHL